MTLTSGLNIRSMAVEHRRDFTDTCAFFISGSEKTMFFCPDIDQWAGMNPTLCTILSSVDFALIDATFYDDYELPGRDMRTIPHPRVVDTVALIKESPPTADVVLIHLNHSNRLWLDRTLQESLSASRMYVGRQGMKWYI